LVVDGGKVILKFPGREADNLMKLGIVSDTHIPDIIGEIPSWVISGLVDCDLIIHAGDITGSEVLAELREIAPVKAVQGNCDGSDLTEELELSWQFEIEGINIALTHGHIIQGDLITGLTYSFTEADLIIFGHTHNAFYQELENQVLLNPGSPTVRKRKKYYSFARVELKAGQISDIGFIKQNQT